MMDNALQVSERGTLLRQALSKEGGAFFMEAHNGVAAKIVERAGFEGIWASSLTLSSALGKRDANEASWSELHGMASYIQDAVELPVLLDGDNGDGDFNTVRQVVRATSRTGMAGVVFEDKVFPKLNSFQSQYTKLIPAQQFAGMIEAGKDSQRDDNFCVIARTEALVAGCSEGEALDRAAAYQAAGADAILVHSKSADGSQILSFLKQWGRQCPVVVVPTSYYSTNSDDLFQAGANLIIWANHMLRASLQAMASVAAEVHRTRSTQGLENSIATLDTLFDLMDYEELREAQARYQQGAARK